MSDSGAMVVRFSYVPRIDIAPTIIDVEQNASNSVSWNMLPPEHDICTMESIGIVSPYVRPYFCVLARCVPWGQSRPDFQCQPQYWHGIVYQVLLPIG